MLSLRVSWPGSQTGGELGSIWPLISAALLIAPIQICLHCLTPFWTHEVPVLLASGDDKFCAEARAWVPGIDAVQVKTGIGLRCARHLSPDRARAALREAACRAVKRAVRGEAAPLRVPGPPYGCRVFSLGSGRPQEVPGVERRHLSPVEVEFTGGDLRAVLQTVTSY